MVRECGPPRWVRHDIEELARGDAEAAESSSTSVASASPRDLFERTRQMLPGWPAFAGHDIEGSYAFFTALRTRSSTTLGSASVVVSPRFDVSPSAILRRMRRMILPERVLGRPGANWITSGFAIGEISFETNCLSSLLSASVACTPTFSVTKE